VGLLLVSAPSFRKENKMKKGEKKLIKNKNKPNEVVIAEKVIDTRKNDLSKDPLILEISAALFALEEKQESILNKINQLCTRIGIPKI
jgi:methyl coenzyme M reductase subunit C-like uncharacterized protein (methanogenesis marker protein 7)